MSVQQLEARRATAALTDIVEARHLRRGVAVASRSLRSRRGPPCAQR